MELEAKVATVLSEFEIAINAGSSKGVRTGNSARVWRDVIVTDPDTHELLGRVRLPKLKFTITRVENTFSVATVENEINWFPRGVFGAVSAMSKRIDHDTSDSNTINVEVGESVTVDLFEEDVEEPLEDDSL